MPSLMVPKDIRQYMPEWIEETALGHADGARRQYRHGRLHIREYDYHYEIHYDRIDPREDPFGHIIHDAPEVLWGTAGAAAAGFMGGAAGSRISPAIGAIAGLAAGAIGFGVSMNLARRLRKP